MMKCLLFLFVSFFIFSSRIHSASGVCELRFSTQDACKFGADARTSLTTIRDYLIRSKSLATTAYEETLGTTERHYLDMEFDSYKEEVRNVLDHSYFGDSFAESHRYLRDGIHFVTLLNSTFSQATLLRHFDLEALPRELGQYAKAEFSILIPEEISTGYLVIGNTTVSSSRRESDVVSEDRSESSAIAVANNINEQSGSTRVYADAEPNILLLGKGDFNWIPSDLSSGHFKLNGVNILGTKIESAGTLIDAINSFSNQTGIQARIHSGTIDQIEILAKDSRNITVEGVGEWIAHAFEKELKQDKKNTFAGSVTIRSAAPVDIYSVNFQLLGFQGVKKIELNESTGLFHVNISSRRDADKALSSLDQALSAILARLARVEELMLFCKS
jgi:flagellin-like hook-associated protein FlgL